MKKTAKIVLIFMAILWLTACVSVVKFNIGSNIHTSDVRDDQSVGQKYDAVLTPKDKR